MGTLDDNDGAKLVTAGQSKSGGAVVETTWHEKHPGVTIVVDSKTDSEISHGGHSSSKPLEFDRLVRAADLRRAKPDTEPIESSDTEADEGAQPKGSGWKGHGPPLQIGQGSSARDLCDGVGLCSKGKWATRERPKTLSPPLQAFCVSRSLGTGYLG